MYKTPLFFLPEATRPLFTLLLLIDLILKGITLYKSARRDQKVWFVLLLLVNSLGILPVIYLFVNKDVTFSSSKGTVSIPKVKVTVKKKRK